MNKIDNNIIDIKKNLNGCKFIIIELIKKLKYINDLIM